MSIEAAFFGTIARGGESKTSKAGKPYLRINVRVGEGEAVQWVNVTAFDESAINTADKFVKGARVYVEGRLTLDQWEKDDEKRAGLSCLSWHCRLAQIGRNKSKRKGTDGEVGRPLHLAADAGTGAELNDDLPF